MSPRRPQEAQREPKSAANSFHPFCWRPFYDVHAHPNNIPETSLQERRTTAAERETPGERSQRASKGLT